MFSYIIGLLALPFLFAATRLWYGWRTGLVTTAIAAISILFLQSTYARPNALSMVAVSLTFFLHVYAFRQGKARYHFLVGLLAGLALDTHLNTVIFLFAYAGYYVVNYIECVRRERQLLSTAALWPFLVGATLGVLVYYLGRASVLNALASGSSSTEGYVDFLRGLLSGRLNAAVGRLHTYWSLSSGEVVLILLTTIGALARRTGADRHWLILMAFVQLGYVLFGPNATLHYLIDGLVIFMASTGALVTYGLDREERAALPRHSFVLLGIAVLLIANDVDTLRMRNQNRLAWVRRRAPIIEYIENNVDHDEAILGSVIYYPYLCDYLNYLHVYFPDAALAPALAHMDEEVYWRNVLLTLWPVVRIDPPEFSDYWPQIEVQESYMAARHAEEIVPYLWAVTDGTLVTDAAYAQTAREAELQMVAHSQLPSVVNPGTFLEWDSLWVTHQAIEDNYIAELSLISSSGGIITQSNQTLVSGWEGTTSANWHANEFHDVSFRITIPDNATATSYTLQLELHSLEDPMSDSLQCAPECRFVVDEVVVTP